MAFDDFGFDLGSVTEGLTDLPIGGLPGGSNVPLPDFSFASGGNFFPGEGGASNPFASVGPTAGGAAPGGDGGGAGIGSALSGFAKDALPFLRLGTGVLGAGVGINALNSAGKQQAAMDRAQRTSEAAAAPGVAAAGQLIPAGTQAMLGGPLPPELEAQVNQFVNNARMKARQTLAKMGITDSTAAAQMDSWIDQQAQELRAKLAGGLVSTGAGVIPPGVTGQAGQIATQQSGSINQAIQEAQRAMFNLLGQQG